MDETRNETTQTYASWLLLGLLPLQHVQPVLRIGDGCYPVCSSVALAITASGILGWPV